MRPATIPAIPAAFRARSASASWSRSGAAWHRTAVCRNHAAAIETEPDGASLDRRRGAGAFAVAVRDLPRPQVLILGSTGFVGKVLLSMLLDRFPQVGRAYVMVRRGSGTDSEARFWQSVVTSPAFDPLREKHGGRRGAGRLPAREGAGRRRRHHRAEPGAVRGGGRAGGQGHRRPHQLVGAGDVQPAARVGPAHQRRGDEERHRLRASA